MALHSLELFSTPQVLVAAEAGGAGRGGQTLRRARPLPRREASTLRPPLVAMRARKP